MKIRNIAGYLPLFLLFVSLIFALFYDFKYSLNIPIADQWTMIKHLNKLDFNYLWASHNEHIIFFPKLIFFILAKLSHWNIKWEIMLGFLLFSAIMSFLYYSLIVNKNNTENNTPEKLIVGGLLLIFCTPLHYQNWLWGWQIQILLSTLASIIAFYLLSNMGRGSKPRLLELCIIIISLIVAGFSFFTGLIAGFIALLMAGYLCLRRRINWLIFVVIAATFLAVLISYFNTLHGSAHMNLNLIQLLSMTAFILTYLGVVFSSARTGSSLFLIRSAEIFAFISGSLFMAITIIVLVKNIGPIIRKNAEKDNLFYSISLLLFGLIVGISLSAGRENFGLSAALSSRYRIFNMFFILGLANLVFFDGRLNKMLNYKIIKGFLVMIFAMVYIFNWIIGIEIGNGWIAKYSVLTRLDSISIDHVPSDYVGGISKEDLINDLKILKQDKLAAYNNKSK